MIQRATLVVFAFVCFAGMLPAQVASVPRSGHVVLIIEENHSYSQVYPKGMPWLSAQASTNGAIASNFDSPINDIGSLGAYLWLSSGSTETQFGCNGGGCTKPITDDNIFRELDMRGITWKVYAQSLSYVGYTKDGPYPYVKRHNPAVWYSSVLDKSTDLQRVVPFTQFQQDLQSDSLPEYSVIIPDLMHDAHDGSLAQADSFLSTNLPALFNTSYFKPGGDGILFLTFDECGGGENSPCGAHIFSTLLGPLARKGYVSSTAYTHSDMLRTIEDALNLQPYFGAAANARPMLDLFSSNSSSGSSSCSPPSSPGAIVCSPASGSSTTSPVLITGAGTDRSGTVNHLELWIDGNKINNYPGNQMSMSLSLPSGKHTAAIVEVNNSGAYLKSSPSSFTVSSNTCNPPTSAGVVLCSPAASATYSSKLQVVGAGTLSNAPVNHLELWIDGKKMGNYPGNTINTTVNSSTGSHSATLVVVDAKGNYVKGSPVKYKVQ